MILPRANCSRKFEISAAKTSGLKSKVQAAATARENDQLRMRVGWQQQQPWKLKLANVVMRDPANWWRTVQIDLGSRDGLR
jgi:cell shape-determining protein MreC